MLLKEEGGGKEGKGINTRMSLRNIQETITEIYKIEYRNFLRPRSVQTWTGGGMEVKITPCPNNLSRGLKHGVDISGFADMPRHKPISPFHPFSTFFSRTSSADEEAISLLKSPPGRNLCNSKHYLTLFLSSPVPPV
ncbi:hypothetical protein CEXT_5351 [Caerostris extrusa]|uniref:Uncharacterized protein n=1 Tax=Caerostris extrusa TaxID=172846 RepID=A0AAV4S6S4_CAEEX|nr:hypothetical protein CEXT_5351 [Caerostris extrusa]